jgi:hypothetical protein
MFSVVDLQDHEVIILDYEGGVAAIEDEGIVVAGRCRGRAKARLLPAVFV